MANQTPLINGELKEWHRIDLTFDGPQTSKADPNNPFLNYRLNVTFTNGQKTYVVPGYYAADGNAGETSAAAGNRWRVHFTPDEVGTWTYSVSFRQGANVAIDLDPNAGTPAAFDGSSGSLVVRPTDKGGRDFRGKGRLQYTGKPYLQFAGTGDYFLKGGANSPENFLAYHEFDNTFDTGGRSNALQDGIHRYTPHVGDWRPSDPTWQGGKGKGIIGALNYLASEGMNSVYFLTYNVDRGDGQDVWMWTSPTERTRFDVSKLDQWETVFSHMNQSGLMLHIVTQEKENDERLSNGRLGLERRLYYRELIARFGHHLGLQWNLGEETDNTTSQLQEFAQYIRALDPYDHPIVVHTLPWQHNEVYDPLLGFGNFEGPSLQISKNPDNTSHSKTLEWRQRSQDAGRPWIVTVDEIGPAEAGVKPDADDPTRDRIRYEDLWGNLMAGGAGVEWYFGYDFPNDDLDTEDWRSRDVMWDQTRYALEFFQTYLPFEQMRNRNELTAATNDYVFARDGEVYAIYLPVEGTTDIPLADGNYRVQWYNPRTGGALQTGSVARLVGGRTVSIGQAPSDPGRDWVALITKRGIPTASLSATNVTTRQGSDFVHTITVTYTDDVAIDVETLDSRDIRVTGPNGFNQLARLVSVNDRENGSPRTARYAIAPSGGTWSLNDTGTYTLSLEANQVSDTDPLFIPATVLGSIQVLVQERPQNPDRPGTVTPITGTSAPDVMGGTSQRDNLKGLKGNDLLMGEAGDDILRGGDGSDRLLGSSGNDWLWGGNDDDIVYGGNGNDILRGGPGADSLRGGAGRDVFVLGLGHGRDIIRDFRDGEDRLRLLPSLRVRDLTIARQGRHTLLSVGTEPLALLLDVQPNTITAADFAPGNRG